MSLVLQGSKVLLEQVGTAASWNHPKITSTAVFGLRKEERSDRESKWSIPHSNRSVCETEPSLHYLHIQKPTERRFRSKEQGRKA